MTDLVHNARLDDGDLRVITYVYHIAHHVIPTTRVSRVWMDTGVTRVLLVTQTVWTRVIKTQAIADALVDITTLTRTKVGAHYVMRIVTTKHAIPILECVTRVAWVDTGKTIAIKRATTDAIKHAHKTLDIARDVQIILCMDFFATNSVLQIVCQRNASKSRVFVLRDA